MSLHEPTTSTRVPLRVASQMLLVTDPAIRTILLAEPIFGEMLSLLKQLHLLGLDSSKVVGMHT